MPTCKALVKLGADFYVVDIGDFFMLIWKVVRDRLFIFSKRVLVSFFPMCRRLFFTLFFC